MLPQARVVRKAGQVVGSAPQPKSDEPTALQTFFVYAVGMWPLTGILLLMFGLLYMAALNAQP
jgi:predicted membrane protein